MPWTTDDLATLDAAIASGVRKIRFSDREVEYQSVKEMLTARTDILNSLTQTNGTPQVRMVQIYTRSGF